MEDSPQLSNATMSQYQDHQQSLVLGVLHQIHVLIKHVPYYQSPLPQILLAQLLFPPVLQMELDVLQRELVQPIISLHVDLQQLLIPKNYVFGEIQYADQSFAQII